MVCFLGTPTAKEEKAELRELNATVPDVPQYLDWSEAPITWDKEDHLEPDRFHAIVGDVGLPFGCPTVDY